VALRGLIRLCRVDYPRNISPVMPHATPANVSLKINALRRTSRALNGHIQRLVRCCTDG
jgi:hypothetical protein